MTIRSVRHSAPAIPVHKPTAKAPTAKQLSSVLNAWNFQMRMGAHGCFEKTLKPKALTEKNILKEYTLSQPKPGIMGGATIKAYVLKGEPRQVVYEKLQALAPPNGHRYFGPVSTTAIPK